MQPYGDLPYNRIVRQESGLVQLQIFRRKNCKAKMRVRTAICEEDAELISKYRWSYTGKYFISGKQPNRISLHRLIALGIENHDHPAFSKLDVHHKNGNRLNNRRQNLEVLTKSEHRRIHCPISPHGTENRYSKHRCRCSECKKAHRDMRREQRANKKQRDLLRQQ